MIIILTALYQEAEPLIKELSLKLNTSEPHYRQYINDEEDIVLTITGVGLVNAAAATGYVLAQAGSKDKYRDLHVINIGSCSIEEKNCKEHARLYLCSKVTNDDSGRDFYPDMMMKSELPEAALYTASRVYEGTVQRSESLCTSHDIAILHDMEGAAIIEAAERFIGPHQVHILKYVTDNGDDAGRVTPAIIRNAAQSALGETIKYINSIRDERELFREAISEKLYDYVTSNTGDIDSLFKELRSKERITRELEEKQQDFDKAVVQFANDIHASDAMKLIVRQLLKYAMLADIDYLAMIQAMHEEGTLPCKDRNAGKKALNLLKKRICER